MKLLDKSDDDEYIKLMRLPDIDHINANTKLAAPAGHVTLAKHVGAVTPSVLSKSLLTSSLLKRKSSTPQTNALLSKKQQFTMANEGLSTQTITASESKVRVLTSALKANSNSTTQSVTKSVKFQASRYTRFISENQNYVDNEEIEEQFELDHENMMLADVEAKQLFSENDEYIEDTMAAAAEPVMEPVVTSPRQDPQPQNDTNVSVEDEQMSMESFDT